MVQSFYYFVLIPMAYFAFAVFVIGVGVQGVRLFVGLKHALPEAVGPARQPKVVGALLDALFFPRVFALRPWSGVVLLVFHSALLLLLLGHLELVAEIRVLQVVPHEVFLGAGVVGLLLLATTLYFLARRFHSPLRELSAPGDYYLLILLFVAILLGSGLHLARRWFGYDTVSVDEYRDYLSGLLTLKPVLPEMFREEFVGHTILLGAARALRELAADLFSVQQNDTRPGGVTPGATQKEVGRALPGDV